MFLIILVSGIVAAVVGLLLAEFWRLPEYANVGKVIAKKKSEQTPSAFSMSDVGYVPLTTFYVVYFKIPGESEIQELYVSEKTYEHLKEGSKVLYRYRIGRLTGKRWMNHDGY